MFFSNSQSAAMVALLARSIERTCARIIYSYAMRRLTAVEVGCDEDRGPRHSAAGRLRRRRPVAGRCGEREVLLTRPEEGATLAVVVLRPRASQVRCVTPLAGSSLRVP